ncbi:hypothetical protein BASA81_001580 [Batrachochytrium salamandrivorans]|nr:hypothetical protein BASA81_001580 [Batrachochytrium salamandrivorans]
MENEEESKRLHVGQASNLEKSFAKLTDNASTLEEKLEKTWPEKVQNTKQTQLPQSDLALDAFDRLRVREVKVKGGQTASAVLAEFQSIAASLEPNERIELEVTAVHENMESLKAVLSDPQASKICSLRWEYNGEEDVNPVIPLLINNCPELALLEVSFEQHSSFDFVSSMLEHPCNKIKVLHVPPKTKGDFARFFAALGQSQVSALTLSSVDSHEFARGLHEYLAKGLLVRLKVWMNYRQVPSGMTTSLAKCARLVELELVRCFFSPTSLTHFPKPVTKLVLCGCRFVDGFDWSFLAHSNVRELDFNDVGGVDGKRLGGALAVYLRAKGLDKLQFFHCYFVNETLVAVGMEIGRIKRLDLGLSILNGASIELIALVLQSPNNELRELKSWHCWDAANVENHLVPALKHPNCNLAKLVLSMSGGSAKTMEDFYNRLALFVLLQGQQRKRKSQCPLRRLRGLVQVGGYGVVVIVFPSPGASLRGELAFVAHVRPRMRRLYCPLRRLPVEMFRLVGAVLI